MFRILLFLVVLVGAALAAAAFVPLKTIIDLAHLEKIGFTTSGTEGTGWQGRIYDARLGRIALGDIETHAVPAELLKGRLRIDMAGTDPGTQLSGGFSIGWGGIGIDGLNLTASLPGEGPVPGATLFVENLTARFPGTHCGTAGGAARAYMPSPLAGVVPAGSMQGPALCRDGALTFDLASDTGDATQEVAVNATGGYRLRATIKPRNALIATTLARKGFTPGPDGYVYQTERRL
ncbi:type II secretion system protein N [Sphingomonas montanisoli]|uniref:Type II secretion system protein N n=1 Tax=Sphingomonas montanisoli TaxID=2606412 RepID=A0A5D9CBD5_9SPHN|nr:type II secretion system protein N [Sphingomonas montanisoli]TZG29039.1 type II secretion system protein N [Sphingomonas montanisoli]